MTSKEKLKAIKDFFWNEQEPSYNAHQFFEDIEKDLEEKELLETELKLEKDKVKYVMKQLKKQDKILDILKVESCLIWAENGEIYSGRYGDIEIPLDEDDFNGKENYEIIKEWLDE